MHSGVTDKKLEVRPAAQEIQNNRWRSYIVAKQAGNYCVIGKIIPAEAWTRFVVQWAGQGVEWRGVLHLALVVSL